MEQATMKALVYHGPNQISLDDVPVPKILKADDVIIRVTLSAICTSDVHIATGHIPDIIPDKVLGHEFCGEIVEIGPEVSGFAVGDRVMVKAASKCGVCESCQKGGPARHCIHNGNGHGIFGAYGPDGCQAEYMRIPAGAVCMFHIPDDLREEDVVLVTDMLATGLFGVQKARVAKGDIVLVVGCGPVGLSACAVARLYEPQTIIAVDILGYRVEAAVKAGVADYAINASLEDVVQRVAEITNGQMANAVIETSGSNASLNTAILVGGNDARICTVALFSSPITIPNMNAMVLKNIELITGIQEGQGLDLLIAGIRTGKLDPKFMLTHKAPLNEILKGYEVFSQQKDNCIKWLVTPYERD